MIRFLVLATATTLTLAAPAWSQDHDYHPGTEARTGDHQHGSSPAAVLAAYRDSLTQRDADAMTALFAANSLIVENGKAEGTFDDYMQHHLRPELDAISSFEFFDVETRIEMLGDHVALGRETYRYRIELTDGRVFERTVAATSVLTHQSDGEWKILRYHSSSRLR